MEPKKNYRKVVLGYIMSVTSIFTLLDEIFHYSYGKEFKKSACAQSFFTSLERTNYDFLLLNFDSLITGPIVWGVFLITGIGLILNKYNIKILIVYYILLISICALTVDLLTYIIYLDGIHDITKKSFSLGCIIGSVAIYSILSIISLLFIFINYKKFSK